MNVVFDLGGVVFTWNPEDIITATFDDPEAQDRVREGFMRHEDWAELDRGTLRPREAITRGAQRTGLPEDSIAELLNAVPSALVPIPATVALLHELKARSHQLLCLSNMQWNSIHHLEAAYSFWDVFDGRVISCRVQLVKPEPEIYEYLLREHELDPRETVFIDDTQINLEAAARFGIRTVHFQSPEQCEEELRDLGCL